MLLEVIIMVEATVRFWEGRIPPPEYYTPLDPYDNPPPCRYNLMELTRYARNTGKRIAELTYDEIAQFSVCD